MANGTAGRPTAAELAGAGRRCQGRNRYGQRCGNAVLDDLPVCKTHLGPEDAALKVSAVERLRAASVRAFDMLEAAMEQGMREGALAEDRSVGVRAAQIIIDRVAPKPSSQSALVIVNNDGRRDNAPSAGDVVRRRLAELAEAAGKRQALEQQAAEPVDAMPWDVIDAELVDEDVTA